MKRKISRDKKRFNEAAGSWSDIDAEEFKERVKEEREESTSEKVEL